MMIYIEINRYLNLEKNNLIEENRVQSLHLIKCKLPTYFHAGSVDDFGSAIKEHTCLKRSSSLFPVTTSFPSANKLIVTMPQRGRGQD